MYRQNFREPFSIRIFFIDRRAQPVSLKDTDADIEFFTRPGYKFLAKVRVDLSTSCHLNPDGSVTVFFDHPDFQPGVLKGVIYILSNSQGPRNSQKFQQNFNLPVEIVYSLDSGFGYPNYPHFHDSHPHAGREPLTVTVQLDVDRPDFAHHVTAGELRDAMAGMHSSLASTISGEQERASRAESGIERDYNDKINKLVGDIKRAEEKAKSEQAKNDKKIQSRLDDINRILGEHKSSIKANKDAIKIINGDENTKGSIKNAVKISKNYADSKDNDLANSIKTVNTQVIPDWFL